MCCGEPERVGGPQCHAGSYPPPRRKTLRKTFLSHAGRAERGQEASRYAEWRPLLGVTAMPQPRGDRLLTSVLCCESPEQRGRRSAATSDESTVTVFRETNRRMWQDVHDHWAGVRGAGRSLRSVAQSTKGPPGSSVHGTLQAKALLQGTFPTQGSNPGPLHCRRILCHVSHQMIQQ